MTKCTDFETTITTTTVTTIAATTSTKVSISSKIAHLRNVRVQFLKLYCIMYVIGTTSSHSDSTTVSENRLRDVFFSATIQG